MDETRRRGDTVDRPAAGHEASDIDPRRVAWWGAALAGTIVAAVALTSLWFFHHSPKYAAPAVLHPPTSASGRGAASERPGVRGSEERQETRAAEDAVLSSYGWVDRESGIVRIPVDRALEALAEKGLPAREKSVESHR